VRLFAELGIDTLVLTNAAGSIRRSLVPGRLMLIADQINLSFRNPLSGPVERGELRFPDMSCPYDGILRDRVREAGLRLGIAVEEGVYAGVPGPSYETPAEIRMLERLGADAVGMSTVPEVIAARARGMRCLGISTITNAAAGITGEPLSHADVIRVASRARADLGRLLTEALAR
jgi:purine-nucleoside phosphorylase